MFARISCKPGTTQEYHTGSWRTTLKPKYLRQNCVACRRCVWFCPEGIVAGKERNTFHADYRYCKGCGICAEVCPKDDIEMVPEES